MTQTTNWPLRSTMQLFVTGATWMLAGCATQPSPVTDDAPSLLSGFMHGLIALPALLASVVLEVRIYAFPNSGFLYDLGFCAGFALGIGLMAIPVIPLIGGYLTRKN